MRLLDGDDVVANFIEDMCQVPCATACVPTHEGQAAGGLSVGQASRWSGRGHLRQGLEDCGGHDSGPEQRVQREGRSAASCPAGWSRSCGAARRRAGATRRGRRSEGRWRRAAEVPEAATRLGRSCPRAARSTWARGSSRSALVGGATGSRASFARHSLAVGSRCSGAKMAPSARFRSTRWGLPAHERFSRRPIRRRGISRWSGRLGAPRAVSGESLLTHAHAHEHERPSPHTRTRR